MGGGVRVWHGLVAEVFQRIGCHRQQHRQPFMAPAVVIAMAAPVTHAAATHAAAAAAGWRWQQQQQQWQLQRQQQSHWRAGTGATAAVAVSGSERQQTASAAGTSALMQLVEQHLRNRGQLRQQQQQDCRQRQQY